MKIRLKDNPPSRDFTCTFHGRLADNTELVATMEFRHLQCCGVAGPPGPITFSPVAEDN